MAHEPVHPLRESARALNRLSDAEVVSGLGGMLDLWRQGMVNEAAAQLSAHRSESEAMLRFGLDRVLRAHTNRALEGWLSEARAEAARAIASRDSSGTRPAMEALRGPAVVAQVLAGNVAGLALPAVLEALLARSAVVLKPASDDPVTAALVKESLERSAPHLAEAVRVETWQGGDEGTEAAVFGSVDFVVASGGEAMADSLGRRLTVPHQIRGPRFTAGIVGMDWLHAPREWWEDVAREIVLWEQKGCLSPRVVFAAGDPARFANRLAEAMAQWETRWPAPPRTAAEGAAVLAFRVPYEMANERSAGLLVPSGSAWTVAWDTHPSLHVGPPARVVRVTGRPSPGETASLLLGERDRLQGLGMDKLGTRDAAWRGRLSRLNIPRVAPLTAIQDPPAGWRADGRSGLADLLLQGYAGGRIAEWETSYKGTT